MLATIAVLALKDENKIYLNPESSDQGAYSNKRLRQIATKAEMAMNLPKQRRQRGVKLTLQGWQKLQAAKMDLEERENRGNRYTYENLSDRSNLSVDTINKIFSHSSGVDRQSLIFLFSTFNLVLDHEDYSLSFPIKAAESNELDSELLGIQIPLNSPYYVERPTIESCAAKLQSSIENTTTSQPEQQLAKSEEIPAFGNSFNISNSTIKNLSGSGVINYHESPEVSQNRHFVRVRGRVIRGDNHQSNDDLQTMQRYPARGV